VCKKNSGDGVKMEKLYARKMLSVCGDSLKLCKDELWVKMVDKTWSKDKTDVKNRLIYWIQENCEVSLSMCKRIMRMMRVLSCDYILDDSFEESVLRSGELWVFFSDGGVSVKGRELRGYDELPDGVYALKKRCCENMDDEEKMREVLKVTLKESDRMSLLEIKEVLKGVGVSVDDERLDVMLLLWGAKGYRSGYKCIRSDYGY